MSRAGCVEGSPHQVPAGLIHSRQVTPQGQRTPAFAPGTPLQPRERPGWLLHGARPRGAASTRGDGEALARPPGPPSPERSHLRRRRSRLLPRRSESRPSSAASPGRPGSRPSSRLQNTGPAAGAAMETRRFRFRRARTLLTAARELTRSQYAGAEAAATDSGGRAVEGVFWGAVSHWGGSSRAGGVDHGPELTCTAPEERMLVTVKCSESCRSDSCSPALCPHLSALLPRKVAQRPDT